MPGIPQNGPLRLLFHAQSLPKWVAKPPILDFSGHEIKGVADHFGGFQAWIPERSDFFKGPKGPKGPLGPERSDFWGLGEEAFGAFGAAPRGRRFVPPPCRFLLSSVW